MYNFSVQSVTINLSHKNVDTTIVNTQNFGISVSSTKAGFKINGLATDTNQITKSDEELAISGGLR